MARLWWNSTVSEYRDSRIACTGREVLVRGYYVPWGTKRIPYESIRTLDRFVLTALDGKGRIWTTGDFRHWANFDPRRPEKGHGIRSAPGPTDHPSADA